MPLFTQLPLIRVLGNPSCSVYTSLQLVWFEACARVMEVSMLQIISVLGAIAILGAYVANQFRLMGPSNLSYSVMNFIGSAVLTVIAVIEVQWGFILLEAVWALVSL